MVAIPGGQAGGDHDTVAIEVPAVPDLRPVRNEKIQEA